MAEEKEVFALDSKSNITRISDEVCFLGNSLTEENKQSIFVAKVQDIRCVEGNWEVLVLGPVGGWKREFYKLAND